MVPRPRCPAIVPALSNWSRDTAAQAPTFTHAKQAVIHIFAHAPTQTTICVTDNLQTSIATSTGCDCLATNDRSNAQRIRAYLPKRRAEADGLAHRPEVTNPRLFNVAKFERPCQRRTCHPYTCAHTCARAKVSLSVSLSRTRRLRLSSGFIFEALAKTHRRRQWRGRWPRAAERQFCVHRKQPRAGDT